MKIYNLKNKYPEQDISITILFNFYVIIWWLEIGKRIEILGTLRIEFIVGSLLGIIASYRYFSNPAKKNEICVISRTVIIYIAILFLSLPLSINLDVAWSAFTNKIIKYSLMSFFISQFVLSPRQLYLFLFSSLLSFLKIGQEAFYGKMTGSMVWENQGIPRLHGAPGTMFGHPNSLSGKFVGFIPFIWFLYPVINSKIIKGLLLMQVVFSLNIILFTGSRTGYVTFIVMFLLIFFKSRRKWKTFLFLLLAGILIYSTIPADYKNRFMSSFTGKEKEGRSKDARITLFKDSLKVFFDNPLGVGLYCFPIAQREAGRRQQETHNLYTQLLAETGLQGFVCFMAFIYILLQRIKRLQKHFAICIDKISSLRPMENKENKMIVLEEFETNKYLFSLSNALSLFIYVRLLLGFFGHDLLEIYWWIAAGLAISMEGILRISEKRVVELQTI